MTLLVVSIIVLLRENTIKIQLYKILVFQAFFYLGIGLGKMMAESLPHIKQG